MIKEFVKTIMEYINSFYTSYYEDAPKNATFPYVVVPTISISSLDSGNLIMFDTEIYNNELSSILTETIMDTLKKQLSEYSFNNNKIAFHVGFENGNMVKLQEQDLILRRLTFSARVFEKGE